VVAVSAKISSTEASESLIEAADFAILQRCATDAERAVMNLWDPKGRTFWRSTEQRARESGQEAKFFPTVTLHCTDSALSFLEECPDWASSETARRIHQEVVWSVITHKDLKSSLDTSPVVNVFTQSSYVKTMSQIQRLPHLGDKAAEVRTSFSKGVAALLAHPTLMSATGVDLQVHPFLLYHAARALSAAIPVVDRIIGDQIDSMLTRIRVAVRRAVERLLAKDRLGSGTPSDAVALGFCGATLLFGHSREDLTYAITSLTNCLDAQDTNGCWPLGRVVRENKDITSDRIEIPTYEIGEAVALAAFSVLKSTEGDRDPGFTNLCLLRLRRAAAYIERSVIRIATASEEPRSGWCSEHAYGSDMVESWTSATVLAAVVAQRRLLSEIRRVQLLRTFATVSPSDRSWPAWLRWDKFRQSGEVDSTYPILEYLERRIIEPIRSSPGGLPAAGDSRSVSALLFGPPGTSKTTIVRAVADALRWPVVLLSPGSFIERGLEYIEAQARSVFDRLLELSHAVVIFDECDELFRDRAPRPDTEQTRGITAFVTASMLPKLQELHDRGNVLFFICTNHFESIDSAVKRGGRIDHIIGVGPPDKDARLALLRSAATSLLAGSQAPEHLDAAIEELAAATDRFTRPEVQRALRLLIANHSGGTVEQARAAARRVAEQLEGALIIAVDDYSKYRELRKQFSHPVLEAATIRAEQPQGVSV
jgi:hypothetical protein